MGSKLELVADVSDTISEVAGMSTTGFIGILGSCLPLCFFVALIGDISTALYILGMAAIILGPIIAACAIVTGVTIAIYEVNKKVCKRKRQLLNPDPNQGNIQEKTLIESSLNQESIQEKTLTESSLNQGSVQEKTLTESLSNQGTVKEKILVESPSNQGSTNNVLDMSEISRNGDTIVVNSR